jgi:hypothetical protein
VVSQYFIADKGLLKAAERSEAGFNNPASGAGCDAIVTSNRRDFCGADRFGLAILAPVELLQQLGGNE